MDAVIRSCAGMDVHKKTIAVCVRHVREDGSVKKVVRSYRTTTRELSILSAWLDNEKVSHVAMESTGVLWKPIFNVLEGKFTILLCNAHHVKQVPGRKTDVKDCEWLAELLQHGLLRGSFIPVRAVREFRDLTRNRSKLVDQKTGVVNRIHKTLQDGNIKLSSVATSVTGLSGRQMIRAIIGGEDDPEKLADLAHGKLRAKIPELEAALEGRVTDHHRFVLGQLLSQLVQIEEWIAEFDTRIEALWTAKADSPPPPPAEAGPLFASVLPPEPAPTPASGAVPFPEAVRLLMSIPGIGQRTAENVLAEIGVDMRQFPSSRHIASWAGLCPGNNESAGKKRSGKTTKGNRWLRRALVQVAWCAGRTKASYFSAAFQRLSARRGKKKAAVAVAHALLVTIYAMLSQRRAFEDLGADYFDRLDPHRQTRYFVKRLEALGHKVTLEVAA